MIRPYRPADRGACLDILGSNTPAFFTVDDRSEFGAFLDRLPGPYVVVEDKDRIVACGGWALEDDGAAVLTWGMVRHSRHHRGLGKLLLDHRLAAVREDGRAELVRIRTIPSVQGFYERSGFRVIEVVPAGFGPRFDRVTMERSLQPRVPPGT